MDIRISYWTYLPAAPCCLWPPANLCFELQNNRKPIVYRKNPCSLSMKMTALALREVLLSIIHLSSRLSPKLGMGGTSHWFSWSEKASCPCSPCAISDKNGEANYKKSANKWVKKEGTDKHNQEQHSNIIHMDPLHVLCSAQGARLWPWGLETQASWSGQGKGWNPRVIHKYQLRTIGVGTTKSDRTETSSIATWVGEFGGYILDTWSFEVMMTTRPWGLNIIPIVARAEISVLRVWCWLQLSSDVLVLVL